MVGAITIAQEIGSAESSTIAAAIPRPNRVAIPLHLLELIECERIFLDDMSRKRVMSPRRTRAPRFPLATLLTSVIASKGGHEMQQLVAILNFPLGSNLVRSERRSEPEKRRATGANLIDGEDWLPMDPNSHQAPMAIRARDPRSVALSTLRA